MKIDLQLSNIFNRISFLLIHKRKCKKKIQKKKKMSIKITKKQQQAANFNQEFITKKKEEIFRQEMPYLGIFLKLMKELN